LDMMEELDILQGEIDAGDDDSMLDSCWLFFCMLSFLLRYASQFVFWAISFIFKNVFVRLIIHFRMHFFYWWLLISLLLFCREFLL
jgi:hypothetical protein